MVRRSDQDAAADALYAKVPDVNCKGLCSASCGPIGMSHRERTRIRERTGIKIPTAQQMIEQGKHDCPALTREGSCAAYDVRPMLCRVWGATEGLKCLWGCSPLEGEELLTDPETYRLIGACMDAGGGSAEHGITADKVERALAKNANAASSPAAREYVRRGEAAEYALQEAQQVPLTFASGTSARLHNEALRSAVERPFPLR